MKKNWPTLLIVFVFTLAVYLIFCQKEFEIRHYFLPLANSFLHGRIDITPAGPLNELVTVAGKSYVVYPPMPAVALIPFAAVFGMKISQVYPTVIFAALSGAIFLLVLSKLTSRRHALALSALLLFGTNFFLTSMMGRSWYFAHICAVLFLAISLYFAQNRKPYLAGFFLVAAGLSRLPVFLAFPAVLYFLKPKPKDYFKFFMPVIGGVVLFAFYNFARFGSFVQTGYSMIPGVLKETWFQKGIFSLDYIPRNLEAIFLLLPKFSSQFPYCVPTTYGMALYLTTPALLALIFVLKNKRSLVMIGTSALILIPSLLHGTVGFSQFGYRFSLDCILLLIIALIPAIEHKTKLVYWLIGLSILINFYVVVQFAFGYFRP